MLKRYSAFFSLFRSILDITLFALSWVVSYGFRFHSGFFDIPKGTPPFSKHLTLILPVVILCYGSCILCGLYKTKRIQGITKQIIEVAKASVISGLFVLAFLYYLQAWPYSRLLLVIFVICIFISLILSHIVTIWLLRRLRKKGYNIRYYAVIGAGKSGQKLVRDIQKNSYLGLKCTFFVDDNPDRIGKIIMGISVHGPVSRLPEIIKNKKVDEIYLALSGPQAQAVYPTLELLQAAGITIRIIPDWGNLMTVSAASAVRIGDQILFSAENPPLSGVNIIIKELFDRVVAFILLLFLAIPMLIVAILVKATSKGPVFYRQIRVGMDQREFEILKFRTMPTDAEKETGPVWSTQGDKRTTRIGSFLRKTSLDELPQLINVLKGEMSLVGPRPERPHFVRQFSEEYRKYMLRHKLKAGMTGWAQVYGFRGNTSLRKRLQYDLYYIRNWSIWLDIRILMLTPIHLIRGKNAH